MQTRGVEWTVTTWNLQGSERTDIAEVARTVTRESPDVVVLQEVRRSQDEELARALSMSSTWAPKHNPFHPFLASRTEGASILTPHRLLDVGSAVVSDATSWRTYRRRIAVWATVERGDASGYRVYGLHLSPHDGDARRREADRVARIVASHPPSPPAIVAGDLNDAHDPEIVGRLPGVEHLVPAPTNPSDDPTQVLDHVLVPVEATSVAVTVPAGGDAAARVSDHLPVTVRFTLGWVGSGIELGG
ncbi:endonuclease/exonuclease/phosphatase family protein [Ilumatobacter sp.]|uniref:endonuclease/exonuclease/phosphatase family protein n=1 Tax=Ilumatobacter sp. TaxID=1967498 RepID=UPI003B52C669